MIFFYILRVIRLFDKLIRQEHARKRLKSWCFMDDTVIISTNIRSPSPECICLSGTWPYAWYHPLIRHYAHLWPCILTGPYYRDWPFYQIPRGFHRTFATSTVCKQSRHLVLSYLGPANNLMWDQSLQELSCFRISNFEHSRYFYFTSLACYNISHSILYESPFLFIVKYSEHPYSKQSFT